VTQSVTKLLARVVTPDSGKGGSDNNEEHQQQQLHEHTYGIASDPLTQFACAFSALVHDVDHHGVSNAQLVQEGSELAMTYRNKSVAEQNSVDVAWSILMEPQFRDLRMCIYTNREELDRFRQLVVNAVMATDVMDKELNALRRKRWEKAFLVEDQSLTMSEDHNTSCREIDSNRKATIVIEHLIQASDVAHTMQHWHIYIKWNERLFHEMRHAYEMGRAGDTDPAVNWYQGELAFFDFYILPLAQKLKECGVFGVASQEYLLYAQANRREWALKGEDTVKSYLETYQQQKRLSECSPLAAHECAADGDDDNDSEVSC
jgi:3'5'-cyclic nucleotide phosphodiesterase